MRVVPNVKWVKVKIFTGYKDALAYSILFTSFYEYGLFNIHVFSPISIINFSTTFCVFLTLG